jgi:hypothetical protein
VGDAEVLVQAAAVLLLVVWLVRCGGWGLLVLQGLLVVVEGERKMWVDHNTGAENPLEISVGPGKILQAAPLPRHPTQIRRAT